MLKRLARPAATHSFLTTVVRDAIRSLRKTPLITSVAIASLALGIGANTALFSILNGLVIRPLPVREPHRLALLGRTSWTNPIWEQIRNRQADYFESACAWSAERFNLAPAGRVDAVDGGYVSGGFFQTLGIETIVGRPLTPADDVRGGGAAGHAAVVSHRFWQQRLSGASDVIGRQLAVNSVPFTIVGVARPGFVGPEVGRAMDIYVPLASEAAIRGPESALDGRSSWWLEVMVRLKPDMGLDATTAALNTVRPAIREATMPPNRTAEYQAEYLTDPGDFQLIAAAAGYSPLRARFAQPLTILLLVAAAVLLIACANIANLLLARATSRRHEMSVRLALGASRLRLGCQLFVESLSLAFAGGAAGVLIAQLGAAFLVRQFGTDVSAVALDVSIDWRVLSFTFAVALATTLLFGLAPAVRAGRVAAHDALKDQGRTMTGDRRSGFRHALVITQVALSFVLVAGAGLFLRTFTALANTPLGFDPEGLMIVSVDAARTGVARDQTSALGQQLADEIARVPGVARASLSYLTPLSGRNWTHRVEVSAGRALPRAEQTTWVNAVDPGWFETYGMRLVAGRDIQPEDVSGSERVVVVNEAFVRRFLGAQNPLGHRVRNIGLGTLKELVIVGVVTDAVYRTMRAGIVPTMYLPMRQAEAFGAGFAITARTSLPPRAVERGMVDAITRTDANLVFSFRDYQDQLRASVVQERLVATLSGFFGTLALLLAGLGLYGVTSYSVARRRAEIGIRLALGATSASVLRLVLRTVLALVVAGAMIGLTVTLWASQFIGSLLFGVEARDSLTMAGTSAVLLAIGVFAGWLPARRASALHPAEILRG